MKPSNSEPENSGFFDGPVETLALGLAYVLVGIGLFYSIATESNTLLLVVLAAILALIVVSLYIIYRRSRPSASGLDPEAVHRREWLLTAENGLIGGFVLLAMVLLILLAEFTTLSFEVVFGIVFVVGVLVPVRSWSTPNSEVPNSRRQHSARLLFEGCSKRPWTGARPGEPLANELVQPPSERPRGARRFVDRHSAWEMLSRSPR